MRKKKLMTMLLLVALSVSSKAYAVDDVDGSSGPITELGSGDVYAVDSGYLGPYNINDSGNIKIGELSTEIYAYSEGYGYWDNGNWYEADAYASGIYLDGNTLDIKHITVDGSISAEAEHGENNTYAAGIHAHIYGDVFIGTVDGDIIASSGEWSDGISVDSANLKIKDLTGNITADSYDGSADGIEADNNTVTIGTLSGTIRGYSHANGDGTGINLDYSDFTLSSLDGGVISGTSHDDDAYGINAYESTLHIVDLSGEIRGDANDNAYGVLLDNSTLHITSMTEAGNIRGISLNEDAYGIDATDSSVIIGTLSGTIEGSAGNSAWDGTGIYLHSSDLEITSLMETGNIRGISLNEDAYGIDATDSSVIIGTLSGTIEGSAGNNAWDGTGIYLHSSDLNITTITDSGSILGFADNNSAMGIEGDSSTIHIETMAGVISADSYDYANGINAYAGSSVHIVTLSGTISGTAEDSGAWGIDVEEGSPLTIDTLSGRVTAKGAYEVRGIESSEESPVQIGTLSGTISAEMTGDLSTSGDDSWERTAAINMSNGALNIDTITQTGRITVLASGDATGDVPNDYSADIEAAGIALDNGSSLHIGTLAGTISARAMGDEFDFGSQSAYGISSLDGSSITIDDLSGTISAVADHGSAWAIYADDSEVNDSITMTGSGKLVGDVALGGGDDTLIVKDLAVISTVPVLDGGAGVDALTFDGWTGTLHSDTLAPSVINWEQIALTNSTTLTLPGDLFAVAFTDLTIDATSTLVAKGSSPGIYTLTGDVDNDGTITMLDDLDATDHLTIDGNYVGHNGTLKADINTATSATDLLTITGDASGSTAVVLNEVGTLDSFGRNTPPAAPIQVVVVEGTSTSNAFFFGNPGDFDFGITAVDLIQGASDNEWYLASLGYREEVAVFQSVMPFIERSGYESVSKFHERRAYNWIADDGGEHTSWWTRTIGSKYRLGLEGDAATQLDGYNTWVQLGTDLVATGDKDSRVNLGLFAGLGHGNADVEGLRSDKAGKLSMTSYGLGAYATLHNKGSWYVDVVGQAINNNLEIDYLAADKASPDTWSYLASLEAGTCWKASSSFRVEPQAQFIYQQTKGIDISTVFHDVNIADHDGLQGRLSLTGLIGKAENKVRPFVELSTVKDFSESSKVSYLAGTTELSSTPEDWFVGGAIGLSKSIGVNDGLGYYLKAGALYGMNNLDSHSYSLLAGLKMAF